MKLRSLTTATIGILAIGVTALIGPGAAAEPPTADELAQAYQVESEGLTPIPVGSARRQATPTPSCSTSDAEGSYECVQVERGAGDVSIDALRDVSAQRSPAAVTAAQPAPDWCVDKLNQGRYVTRLADCETFSLGVQKTRTTNGVTTIIGTATIVVISYQYMSYSIEAFAHQLEFRTTITTGDVSGITMGASSVCLGACGVGIPGYISPQALTPAVYHSGESFHDPASVAVGAVNFLASDWDITIYAPTQPSTTLPGNPFDLRCDNNAGGRFPVPGCVVYYAAGEVVYSNSNNPSLVSHIAQAQASGLPGASPADPLNRTTVDSIITANRQAACGNPPSIDGLSCDEYPFASTYQGAVAGGTARSFPGCSFADDTATGPDGFSRCMVIAGQNSSTGAILGNTYRQQRILEADPFYVSLTT